MTESKECRNNSRIKGNYLHRELFDILARSKVA